MVEGREKQPEAAPMAVERLTIWQKSMGLVEDIYLITARWPADERFGLTSQIRRAAVSIPANIAEGAGRSSRGDFIRFCRIALGSAYETHTLLNLAQRLKLSQPEDIQPLLSNLSILTRQISAFIKHQEQKS